MLISSLRDVIRTQSEELAALQKKLSDLAAAHAKEVKKSQASRLLILTISLDLGL